MSSDDLHDDIRELLSLVAGDLEGLAEDAGVSYASLHAWSTGRRSPGRDNLRSLVMTVLGRLRRARALSTRLWDRSIQGRPVPPVLEKARKTREDSRELRRRVAEARQRYHRELAVAGVAGADGVDGVDGAGVLDDAAEREEAGAAAREDAGSPA